MVLWISWNVAIAHCGMHAGTGIIGSKHDLNAFNEGQKDPQGRICAYCHVPHHAEGSVLAPGALWDAISADKTFKPYESATFDAAVPDNLIGATRICLSCHDGTIASDSHPSLRQDSFGGTGVGAQTDLSNDHPIGIDYVAVVEANSGYKSPKALWLDGNGVVTVQSVLHEGRYITCATCHDMHNKHNVSDENFTYNYFVYSRQAKSSLCLSCHDK